MIGRLRGILAEVGEAECLIDCGGVGYVATCGARTLGRLPAPGDETLLFIQSQWSQDQGPRLYGFLSRDERKVFNLMLTIQGVGPKAALGVLDVLPPAELAATDRYNQQNQANALQQGFIAATVDPSYNALVCAMARARHAKVVPAAEALREQRMSEIL
uniref:Holliday junction branch migration protein RuvA n=1 Tax=Brevundimonas sp. TaxID=1871086 RepID=UPI0028A280CA